jgi:hypothetical protein
MFSSAVLPMISRPPIYPALIQEMNDASSPSRGERAGLGGCMDRKQRHRLEEVLVERFLNGESRASLHAQLVQRFAPEEAETLLEKADAEAETRRRERRPARPRQVGRYWRGTIASREHGEKVAKITGIIFGVIGVGVCLTAFTGGPIDRFAFRSAG